MAEAGPEGGTACANHAGNVAVVSCGRCGLFMCALCRIDADGHVLCPACFERMAAEGALPSALTTFRHYPSLAGTTLAVGLLIWPVMPICGPLGAYYAVKGIQQKRADGDSAGRVGLGLAAALGIAEAGGGVLFILLMAGAIP